MKIIFDFDHTLFSTTKFSLALKKSFEKSGIEESLFEETFGKSKEKNGHYKPDKQIELIIKKSPEIKKNILKKEFKKVLNNASKFLYPDTEQFLKKWQKRADLILLSYGENKFQKEKIKKSKITSYFKKILIAQDINKISNLKTILRNNQKAVFVEDNPQALMEAKKTFPDLTTVRINRGKGKYAALSDNSQIDFSIKNLKKLAEILRTNLRG